MSILFWVFPAALVNHDTILIVRDSYPKLKRSTTRDRQVIVHEMSHYFFNSLGPYYSTAHASPRWIDEGGARFMEAYVDDRLGFRPLRARLDEVAELARETCMTHGLENILKLTVPSYPDPGRWGRCGYILGEYMITSLYYAMGEAGLSAALREVYYARHFIHPFPLRHSVAYPSDLQLYQILLKHTPPDRHEAVRDVVPSDSRRAVYSAGQLESAASGGWRTAKLGRNEASKKGRVRSRLWRIRVASSAFWRAGRPEPGLAAGAVRDDSAFALGRATALRCR